MKTNHLSTAKLRELVRLGKEPQSTLDARYRECENVRESKVIRAWDGTTEWHPANADQLEPWHVFAARQKPLGIPNI